MPRPILQFFAVAALALSAGAAGAGSITVFPAADNTLFEDADGDTSNGAGPALFAGSNNQNGGRIRRILLRFDFAARLPHDAVIDKVSLRLFLSRTSDAIPRLMSLHRVTANWGEGASSANGGTGARAREGDATWIHAFYPLQPWQSPGGDFWPVASATRMVDDVGVVTFAGSELLADVRAWRDQPNSNFGWIIRGDENEPGTARRFDSREADDPNSRPALTIQFSTPDPPRTMSWGLLKARYLRGVP